MSALYLHSSVSAGGDVAASRAIGFPNRSVNLSVNLNAEIKGTADVVAFGQPKSAPDDLEKIGSAARAARAEAPPKDRRVTQPIGYQRTPLFDRFSIKGY